MAAPEQDLRVERRRAWIEIVAGVVILIAGVAVTTLSLDSTIDTGDHYIIAYGPMLCGAGLALSGLSRLTGYKSFVAWRYLLVREPRVTALTKTLIVSGLAVRAALWGAEALIPDSPTNGIRMFVVDHPDLVMYVNAAPLVFVLAVMSWGVLRFSKPAMVLYLAGLAIGGTSLLLMWLIRHGDLPLMSYTPEVVLPTLQVLGITALAGFAVAGLAAFFGSLRAFFTFFTTVPIGGVWIGTLALVCVLAVMSGFESDLREKILGSNAHIQITREDGDFTEWREVKQRVDALPGIVASTPFAVSEVVIAANNNGMNVIIKGIDPKTVGKVTDIVSDLEDKDAMARLAPLIDDPHDLTVPQPAQRPDHAGMIDPPPDDMPGGGEPIDFSATAIDSGSGSAGSAAGSGSAGSAGSAAGSGSAGSAMAPPPPPPPPSDSADYAIEPPMGYGSDLNALLDDEPILEPLVRLITNESLDLGIHVVDMPIDTSSRRTQTLPGILVGRELVKQTHLYSGQEVRVVSPLSDPSNPDATGTPIPFNRDYRVAGIFYTGMYEYDLKYVYVTLDSLQDFLDRGDAVDGIEIRVDDPDRTDSYVETLSGLLGPSYRVQDWKELNRSLFSALKLEKIAMFLVLGIVILVASFSIVGNLIMVVVEKGREIALLKTLGASNAGVMQLFAIQGLLIGMIGTLLGVGTGLFLCWAGKRFGLPLNPDVYYIDRLPIHVEPSSVGAAAAAGVLISIAATLYPALLAARIRPAAGMRH